MSNSTKRTSQYLLEDDNDDDMPPPPLPMEPPPSSTSASSQNTNTDLEDNDFLPLEVKLPHSISCLSEEFHIGNADGIVEPPEGFLSSSPRKDHLFTVVSDFLESGGDEEDEMSGRKSPDQLSPAKEINPKFRRVRSNPSLSSLKVKMSVISSSGSPVSSLSNLEMSSETADGKQNNNSTDYNVTSTHSQIKA